MADIKNPDPTPRDSAAEWVQAELDRRHPRQPSANTPRFVPPPSPAPSQNPTRPNTEADVKARARSGYKNGFPRSPYAQRLAAAYEQVYRAKERGLFAEQTSPRKPGPGVPETAAVESREPTPRAPGPGPSSLPPAAAERAIPAPTTPPVQAVAEQPAERPTPPPFRKPGSPKPTLAERIAEHAAQPAPVNPRSFTDAMALYRSRDIDR